MAGQQKQNQIEDRKTILNKKWRLQNLYVIKTEDKKLKKFKFNDTQEELFRDAKAQKYRGIREIDLKERKVGISTFWLLFYLDDTIWHPNTTTCIIAHTREDVQKLFKIVKIAYKGCPNRIRLADGRVWIKPNASYDNKGELAFESINSTIYVALKNRGGTIDNLHISEAAFIENPEERIIATMGAVPNRELGSNITIESTADGVGNWFEEEFTLAQNGLSVFKGKFFYWFKENKYEMKAPKEYEPSEKALEKARKVKERFNIDLSRDKLFWWDETYKQFKRLMDQEFPTFPEDAFLASGTGAFDKEDLDRIIVKEPIGKHKIRIKDLEDNELIFEVPYWKQVNPKRTYIVGGDPAEGVGGDRSVIEVVDTLTLEQVAEFVSDRISPTDMGLVMVELGKIYNYAFLAPERNNHGHTVIASIRNTGYSNLYQEMVLDEKLKKKTKKFGWFTNSRTRDLMLDELEDLISTCNVKMNSAIIKSELQTFIVNKDGKREAKSGKHDDTIMAFTIAIKIARMPRSTFKLSKL